MQEMQVAGDHAAERMLERLAGRTGLAAMSAVIMCSTFGAINSNILMAPRIPFAMGRDGLFFKPLGFVHSQYRTPVAAILTTSMMAIGLIGLITLGKFLVHDVPMTGETLPTGFLAKLQESLRSNTVFSLLTNCFTFAASAFYALAVVAVMVLRKTKPTQARPYRTWGYPVVPIVFVSVYAWFLFQIYDSNPAESRVGLLFICSGLPTYFLFRWWNRTHNTRTHAS
jgi:amino acid transporter